MDQDIPDDLSTIMEFATFVWSFLRHNAFEFWSRSFIAVAIPGSQREGICIAAMHRY